MDINLLHDCNGKDKWEAYALRIKERGITEEEYRKACDILFNEKDANVLNTLVDLVFHTFK